MYFVSAGRPKISGAQVQAYLLGFLLIMAGLVLAGPWLIMAGAKVMARHTGRVPMLFAGRRLADNPRGAVRAVRGLILAIFVTSVSVGVISTIFADHGSGRTRPRAGRSSISSPCFSR